MLRAIATVGLEVKKLRRSLKNGRAACTA